MQTKPLHHARPALWRACRLRTRALRAGRAWLLAAFGCALAGALLAGGRSTVAQTAVPTALPVLNITPGPDLTNVGVTYYVDNGRRYSDAKSSASPSIGAAA